MSAFFSTVDMAPKDPILGITEAFNADPNPNKVNLGVGVYTDESGRLPLLDCVREAENRLLSIPSSRGYLPIEGLPAYRSAVQRLIFGAESSLLQHHRVVTVQSLGGTGGLRIGADFLKRFHPQAEVWISDPSWENHRALFEAAGFVVRSYPYYDPVTRGLDFSGLCAALQGAPRGTVVLLHACCHNPSGVDMTPEQWETVIQVMEQQGLVPFLDLAYQGFARGIEEDAATVRRFAGSALPLLLSSSFSKSFSLYGERVGAFSLVAGSAEEAGRVLSQIKRVVRTNYSNPPSHGARVVAMVLDAPDLRALWERELTAMRERIQQMRRALVEGLSRRLTGQDFSYVTRQNGMFSFSGLDLAQVKRLRDEFSVYAVDSGRICVAALNSHNLEAVLEAIERVSV